MDASFRTPSRQSYELPKPDADLAEWTSKIKAIQRQVDADKEGEQNRLEEEITAARQARLRRSRGGTPSHADSVDLSSAELVGMFGNTNTSHKDTPKSLTETHHDRETALRKLMDRHNVYNPDKLATGDSSSRPDSVSLASFIGGRATGPRLNRHTPQADAHDPTQYLQPDLSAPHPVFGTGGVAMPGITTKGEKSPALTVGSEMSERYRPTSASTFKTSFSPTLKNEAMKVDEPTRPEKVRVNRRSFTAVVQSPSSSVAQRYTDIVDKSTQTTTKGTQPLLIKRKSNGSIPKEPLLPSPTKGGGISISPSKSTDHLSSSPLKTNQSIPIPAPSYLRTKSFSSVPPTLATKTGSNTHKGFTSTNSPSKSLTSTSTVPIPTYSLPRNEVSTPNQVTPLRRLMERNNVYNHDKVQTDNFGKSVAERAHTTSLAAFMGGTGKGVRLNKHAPQADAHDPTQFVRPDLSTPHPIFGKGGVAMPGMVTQTKVSNSVSGVDSTGLFKPSITKKAVWPPVSAPSKTEERPVSPQKTGGRARTISTPRPKSSSQSNEPVSELSRSPAKETLVGVPLRDRTLSTPSATSRKSIVTPSLARPIQAEMKKSSSFTTQIPTTTASPAFNKPSAQKDLTPSLSRLQGRGFVQNMVKATSQISNIPSSPSPSPSRPASTTGRKGSVVDRWQPIAQPESPTKPSPPFLSKNATTGSSTSSGSLYGIKSSASFSSLTKHTTVSSSTPKTEDPFPRSRTPGLGSATTRVVIKPSKSFTDLAELGIKTTADSRSASSRKTPIYVR